MLFESNLNKRSQELTHTFRDAGMFYWGRKDAFQEERVVYSTRASVYELSRWKSQDIDTPEDWDYAERLYKISVSSDWNVNQFSVKIDTYDNLQKYRGSID